MNTLPIHNKLKIGSLYKVINEELLLDFEEDRNTEIFVKKNEVVLVVGVEYKTVTYEDFKAIKTIPYSKNQNIILAENESIEIRTYYKILYENKLYDLIFSIDSTYCDRLFHLLKEVKT
jgi:hypothetical protein